MAAFQVKLINSYGGSLDLADGVRFSIDDSQATQFMTQNRRLRWCLV